MENKKLSTSEIAAKVKHLRLESELRKLQKQDARRKRLEKFIASLKRLGRFNVRQLRFLNLTNLRRLLWIALSLLGLFIAVVAAVFLYDQYNIYRDRQETHSQHEESLQRYESAYAYEQATQQALAHAKNLCQELHFEQKGKEYLTCLSVERNKYLDQKNIQPLP